MRRASLLLAIALTLAACAPTPLPPPASTDLPPAATEEANPPVETEPVPPVQGGGVGDFPNPDAYRWEVVADGFDRPVDVQNAGDGSGRLFIVEQGGVIRVLQPGESSAGVFLDIAGRVDDGASEQGLLGLAFHPDFESNGYFYVNYTQRGGDTVIARFTAAGASADPDSEWKLLEARQPAENHNGGGLAFGPDGYLYIALGDGGGGGDPDGNGQNKKSLLGKLLRIDVNDGKRYSVPSDNPFGSEVFHYGLRNPWRFSFDSATGDLWIGDVGQGEWEEIDFLPAGTGGGVNFGWNHHEGMHGYESQPGLDNHTPPVFEYGHSNDCSVTGGYVYRGAMSEWQGVYFYGDYCSGRIWGGLRLLDGSGETFLSAELFRLEAVISSFGVDENGEIYVANHGGSILRLVK